MNPQEPTTSYDLTGKTIVITGASGILGGEIACAMVGCNANVVILDRDQPSTDQVVRRIKMMEGVNGQVSIVYADVLQRDTLVRAEAYIQEEFGSVYALINAAGGNHPQAITSEDLSFFDLPEDALRFVFDINLLGTILPSQVFGRGMAENNHGIIVNISSLNASRPLTRTAAYSAAKAGVDNFTRWLAVHMAQEYSTNIRVNALAPGFFLAKQLLTTEATGDLTPRGRAILEHTPMGRLGTPEDLLGALMWLLSPASAFVTGIIVPIDGGFSVFSGV